MLVSFLGWNAFYGILVTLLLWSGLTALGSPISLEGLLWEPFTYCWAYVFNGPSWFIGTLFLIQACYLLLRKYIHSDILLLVISYCGYAYSIVLANSGFSHLFYNAGITIERMLFCLIFYHLGYIYRYKLEKYDDFNFIKVIAIVLVNGCIISFITPDITTNIHHMAVQGKPRYIPLLTACTGIWLYLQIADLLKDRLNNVYGGEIINYIGNHTFVIMVHHQFFFWLFNTFLLFLKNMHILSLNTFNYHLYMTEIYFRIGAYKPFSDILYVLAGVLGPICCCYLWEKLRVSIYRKKFI